MAGKAVAGRLGEERSRAVVLLRAAAVVWRPSKLAVAVCHAAVALCQAGRAEAARPPKRALAVVLCCAATLCCAVVRRLSGREMAMRGRGRTS